MTSSSIYGRCKQFLHRMGRGPALQDGRAFVVRRSHLQEPLTFPLIEARERAVDPVSGLAGLPFGHLNAEWQSYVSTGGPDDEIWSFGVQCEDATGRVGIGRGYVFVRFGIPTIHFLSKWHMPERESTEERRESNPGTPVAPGPWL